MINCGQFANAHHIERSNGQEYLSGEDTVLAGKIYKKLYFTGQIYVNSYFMGTDVYDTSYFCNTFIGGLREDSTKSVYYKDTTSNAETFLFTFNLTVGSITNGRPAICAPVNYGTVFSIDSIYIYDRYRKRFNIGLPDGSYLSTHLIEGIGYDFGLLGKYQSCGTICGSYSDEIAAYYYNGVNAYELTAGTNLYTCTPIIGLTENTPNKVFNIFPNPTIGFLTIESTDARTYNLEISDLIGNRLMSQNSSTPKTIIDLSKLANGIYILKFSDGEHIYSQKIIKVDN